MSNVINFSEDYKERCYNAWYISELPPFPGEILKVVPSDERGRKPNIRTLARWVADGCWIDRRNEMNARALEKVRDNLIIDKAELFKLQYQSAISIAEKAKENILEKGFDNSNSAVNAYFKATEEQRMVIGISDFFEKVNKMSKEELEKAIADLSESDEIIDAETEDA